MNFAQYEVSNFAEENFQCVHNNSYWHYKDYLGFGTSAHSFVNRKRWWNISSTRLFIEAINKNQKAVVGEEILSQEQMEEEFIMLALRSSGLDLSKLEKKFGTKWYKKNKHTIEELVNNNLIQIDSHKLMLTPKGYAFCDEILLKLL